jgi:hypothetical protein
MLKSKGKSHMVEKPSHVKQFSLNLVCKIGLNYCLLGKICAMPVYDSFWSLFSHNILVCL